MEVRRMPDGSWDVQVTVADVPCNVCWTGGGEPCVGKDGNVLDEPTYQPREGKEAYRIPGPPYYHKARWERAAQRGITPGYQSIRPVREAVRNSAPRKPLYGRSWNPWPEDYGEYKEEWR